MHAHLLIGISVSQEVTDSHRPNVENMSQGLAGLCAALKRHADDQVDGVAIYALWEAEAQDWRTWETWQHAHY